MTLNSNPWPRKSPLVAPGEAWIGDWEKFLHGKCFPLLAQLPRAVVGSPHPWKDLKLCGCGTWGRGQGGLGAAGECLGSMS